MNKYIIQNDESGKQFIAGPVTIEEPTQLSNVDFNFLSLEDQFKYSLDRGKWMQYLADLPRYEWQGEKRVVGDVVVEGADFEFGNKDKNDCCPECGCEEYECEDYLGKGFRNCKSCSQEWWLDVKYSSRFCKVAIPLSKAPSNEAKMCAEMSKKTLAHVLKAEEVKPAIYKENPEWPSSGIGLVMDGGTPIRQEDLIFKAEEVKEKEDGWISVEDRPLFTSKDDIWTLTNDGQNEFLAAVPYNDNTRPKENNLWWIRHCVIDDGGLKVVTDDDTEPAGWSLQDVTHWRRLPPPPKS